MPGYLVARTNFAVPLYSAQCRSLDRRQRELRSADTRGTTDEFNGGFGIVHFHDQFLISLVVQVNDNGFLRVMNVPEDPLAVLIERACRNDSGQVRSGHPNPVIQTACGLRVSPDARNVYERDFEAVLEGPELVSAPDVQRQLAFRYRLIHQGHCSCD